MEFLNTYEERVNSQKGIDHIQAYMKNWTKRYIHATKFVSKRSDTEYVYETEFSIPSNVQPVPEAAVKIHSTITFTDAEISDFWYTFENETLRHRENRSIRIA